MIALYALLLPPSVWFALKVGQDNAIERIMVPTDPDFVNLREFQKVFGRGEYVVLLAEAEDPFAPAVLDRIDRIEKAASSVPGVEAHTALTIFRRAKAGFDPGQQAAEFRSFALGTGMFRKQGLVGDHFLAIAMTLDVNDRVERKAKLSALGRAVDAAGGGSPPLTALRRTGQPYVSDYLDEAATAAGPKYFGIFAVFIVVLNLALYRSLRTLLAFLITLGVCMALSVGYIGLTGGTFTIVSPMVPMTILVTATATLVYLHSRFVDRPPESPVDEHQIFALTNKFVACTASIFATLVGFAALSVSSIRPIRQMGLWVAVGLLLTWIVLLTLFPALQRVLRTPTSAGVRASSVGFLRFSTWLPRASYSARYPLVAAALVLMVAGGVALFGIPGGAVSPMQLLISPVDTALYKDTKEAQRLLPGLGITEVWLKGKFGSVSDPEVLAGLSDFQNALETDPDVGAVISPVTILRMTRYVGGQADTFPTDPPGLEQMASNLEGLLPREPMLQRFVEPHTLAQTHLSVVTRATEHEAYRRIEARIRERWQRAVDRAPTLKQFELKTVGLGPLQAKMSQGLVPTLVESFGLTVAIIFTTFVVVFRSGAARLMTMIPSLFAILVMFGVMRVSGMGLNVATILIASTVLGTSENDQIHFFYHFLERRKSGSVDEALRHTLRVSGKAIFFATVINAGGFLAFALSDLPPLRQFGLLTAVALVMSMLADFTALPAALWIVFRSRPDDESVPAPHERARELVAPDP